MKKFITLFSILLVVTTVTTAIVESPLTTGEFIATIVNLVLSAGLLLLARNWDRA